MKDLPIHSLLNLAAREPAEPRPARHDERRGFERELHRAASASPPARSEKPNSTSTQSPADDATISDESEQQRDHDGELTSEASAPAASQTKAPLSEQVPEQPIDTIELTVALVDPAVAESETSAALNQAMESSEGFAVASSDTAEITTGQRAPASIAIDSTPAADNFSTVVPIEEQPQSVASSSEGDPLRTLAPSDQLANEVVGDGSSTADSLKLPDESRTANLANHTAPIEASSAAPRADTPVGVPAAPITVSHTADLNNKRGESRPATQESAPIAVASSSSSLRSTLQVEVPQAEKQSSEAGPATEVTASQEAETADTSKLEPPTSRGGENSGLLHRAATNRVSVATRSEHSPSEAELRIDPARFVGRVAGAFRVAHDRGGVLQLRLSPPELGSIKLELLVERGALTARIEAESSTARRVLLDNLPALRDRLAQQEIRVERFDVDVRQDRTGSQPDWQGGERKEHRPSELNRYHAPRRAASSASISEQILPSPVATTDGRLNVLA